VFFYVVSLLLRSLLFDECINPPPFFADSVFSQRRLHEKGSDSRRLRQYVQRWVTGLHSGLQGLVTQNRFNPIVGDVKEKKSVKLD
jgi:hypothetical protein